jgi:hypothetical protein
MPRRSRTICARRWPAFRGQLRHPRLPHRTDRGDPYRLDRRAGGAGFGDDLDSLDAAAGRVAAALAAVPGASDVQYDPPAVAPEVAVRLRPEDASLHGLRPGR